MNSLRLQQMARLAVEIKPYQPNGKIVATIRCIISLFLPLLQRGICRFIYFQFKDINAARMRCDDVRLPDDMDAQPCRTDFTPLGYYGPPTAEGKFVPDADGPFTLLEARLHTGRIHQIRATLCSLGWPVVGDKLYGLDERIFLKFAGSTLEEDDWQRLVLRHQALHAMRLEIPTLGIDAACPTPWL